MAVDDETTVLRGGLPSMSDLAVVENSALFTELERFSSEWGHLNATLIAPYAHRWVLDPLHQWSRRWEYPFVVHALTGSGVRKVLDAGAGFTFFPYFVAGLPGVDQVLCVDSDDLAGLYSNVTLTEERQVIFQAGDLRRLPIADGGVDAAYCISVLEHTKSYEHVVTELRRVVAPGGLLIVTFDISLDGLAEIPIATATNLIAHLSDAFVPVSAPREIDLTRRDLLTTARSGSVDKSRLPWRRPFLSLAKASVKRGRLPTARMKNLSCYGAVFRRP
jgi:SAM-dependent methyltransferase